MILPNTHNLYTHQPTALFLDEKCDKKHLSILTNCAYGVMVHLILAQKNQDAIYLKYQSHQISNADY